jgi:periplasmic protein TonB
MFEAIPYSPSQSRTASRLTSVGIHAALVGLALIPWTTSIHVRPMLNDTAVVLYTPELRLPKVGQGGGGGGKHQPTPASIGELPRGADKQLVPPTAEPPKNPDPTLIVESTIVAPQLTLRPLNLLNIGDPNGVIGPPSSGPGKGGGIGDGDGRGDGSGKGPGGIKGEDGGCCEGIYHITGGMVAPKLVYQVTPEYSEEARKARFEGTVVLEAVIRRDGTIDVVHLLRSLGFGLDQNALEAVKKWRFKPATKNGIAVDSFLNVEVRFNLR